MSEADSLAIAAAAKKRLRREARIRENYDRISAALTLSDSKSTKNPTRNVPDVPGFQSLSKTEIKRDTKDIEKNSNFSFSKERNYAEEMDGCVSRSMRPHCAAESTLLKKKRRLLTWINNPDQADKEVEFWRANVTKSNEALAQFETDRDAWLEGFAEARRMLSGALKSGLEANKRLREEGAVLLNLCEQECGYSLRKKRNFQAKDIVEELLERQSAYESAIQEYLGISHDLHAKGGAAAANTAVAYLSLEEVHYAEDDAYIVKKSHASKPTDSTTNTNSVEQEDKMDVVVKEEVLAKVKVEADAAEVALESEQRECMSDIPLPYFCSETKSVIPVETVEQAQAVAPDAAPAVRKGRSSSIGSLKDLPSTVIKTERATSGGTGSTGSDGTAETDATTHPSSMTTNTSMRSFSPTVDSVNPTRKADDLSMLELLLGVQESVRLNELSLTDVEFMFQDRTTCPDDKVIIDSILGVNATEATEVTKTKTVESKNSKSSRSATSHQEGFATDEQKVLAAPYLALNRTHEQDWSSYCDKLFDGLNSQGIITRKGKKRGPEYTQVSLDLRLRTQRGVSLLYSPLSQYEDRMLGTSDVDTIYVPHTNQSTGEVIYHSSTQLPPYLHAAEEDALVRCKLQSAAAIADLNLRKLRASLKEVAKFTQEAHSALARSESLHEMATVEEGLELRKMYKELVHYGLVKAALEDPPMSPLSSNAAAVAASALFNSVFSTANNGSSNNHGRAPSKNSRAPPRTAARPPAAQSSSHTEAGQDETVANENNTRLRSTSEIDNKNGADTADDESLKRKVGVTNGASIASSAPKRRR
mmetsp:Transcript_38922/g.67354  ORF Transcript_38922/g.67354 Transcript_38922/m.67354 type:complete len:818 (-) Transcript_38922:66-2519(-)